MNIRGQVCQTPNPVLSEIGHCSEVAGGLVSTDFLGSL